MKKSLLAVAIAFGTGIAASASAEPYVGASVGATDYRLDCSGASSCDKRDTGFKVFGGYMFTPNFGVEGSYFDLGKARGSIDATSAEAKVSGAALYGIAVAPIQDFSVFAKLGVAYTHAKADFNSPGLSASDSEDSFQPAYGLGGGYQFTRNVGARVEWERFRAKYPGGQKDDTDLFSLGVTYRF